LTLFIPILLLAQENNVGNRMLLSMGWAKGQGIGAAQQGLLSPIKVALRRRGQGLGAD